MNILLLAPYPPYPPYGGGTMRMYQLLRGLAQRHSVTCLSFAPDAAAEAALAPLRDICTLATVRGPPHRGLPRRALTTLVSPLPDMALRNRSAAYRAALARLLANTNFDVVQAESIEMAGYLMDAGSGPATTRPQLVLDQFNVEYMLQRRAALTSLRALASPARALRQPAALARNLAGGLYSLVQWQKLAAYERQVVRHCDVVLAVSREDQQAFAQLAPRQPIAVVPNGVDSNWFSRAALASGADTFLPAYTLVFSGTLDFRPNLDAIFWFAEQVLPLIRVSYPTARLLVIGRRPPASLRALAGPALTIVGEVPDARPYIAAASVYVVPMRIGGGVRLKLLEALALEAPLVSTSMGAEGVAGLQHGQHCLLADTPAAFAAAVGRLFAQPATGRQLAAAGRALVRQHYDWSVIVPQLEAAYDQKIEDRR